MSRHLTQDELIQCKFDLADGPEAVLAREHLEECEECRGRMEKLSAKLSALDELKEEVGVSEELAASTLAGATERRISNLKSQISKRQSDFTMPVWMQGVAAVLVAGMLSYGAYVLVNNPASQKQKTVANSASQAREPGKKDLPASVSAPASPAAPGGAAFTEAGKMSASVPAKEMASDTSQIGMAGVATTPPLPAATPVPAEAKAEEEKAPFAPASAIELNVLPRRENVQLTIYNSADLTLVRESRKLTLKKGWNWLQFMWANTLIDPTSLSMEPKAERDKVGIAQLVYPARLKDVGRWLIHSDVEGEVPFEITYFTSGVRWRAFYMGTLSEDESQMRFDGYVRVDNGSGEEYADAQTRLVVGQVHQLDQIAMLAKRQYPYGSPMEGADISGRWYFAGEDKDKDVKEKLFMGNGLASGVLLDQAANKPKEIVKEGLSEYFLYTIEGTETISDGWGKRLPSFAADGVKVESLFKYDEERWGTSTIRYVSFVNDEEHKLGQTPLPDGMVRVYGQAGDSKGLAYVGSTSVKYIPVNQKVEMNLGATGEVVIEPKLMSFATENIRFGGRGNVRGWEEVKTWRIELRNTRRIPATVEVKRAIAAKKWDIATDEKATGYEKYDATHIQFKQKLGAGEHRTVEYTVRTYHGVAANDTKENSNETSED